MKIESTQIVYSEHYEDECFEYKKGGRVPEGNAIGYVEGDNEHEVLHLFDDIKYSKYDHQYWDNYELEHDVDRLFIP